MSYQIAPSSKFLQEGIIISHPPVNTTLVPEEFITKIEGKTNGGLVDQLTITTRGPDYEVKVYRPFGKTGNLSFMFEGHMVALYGRSSNMLDRIAKEEQSLW